MTAAADSSAFSSCSTPWRRSSCDGGRANPSRAEVQRHPRTGCPRWRARDSRSRRRRPICRHRCQRRRSRASHPGRLDRRCHYLPARTGRCSNPCSCIRSQWGSRCRRRLGSHPCKSRYRWCRTPCRWWGSRSHCLSRSRRSWRCSARYGRPDRWGRSGTWTDPPACTSPQVPVYVLQAGFSAVHLLLLVAEHSPQ